VQPGSGFTCLGSSHRGSIIDEHVVLFEGLACHRYLHPMVNVVRLLCPQALSKFLVWGDGRRTQGNGLKCGWDGNVGFKYLLGVDSLPWLKIITSFMYNGHSRWNILHRMIVVNMQVTF